MVGHSWLTLSQERWSVSLAGLLCSHDGGSEQRRCACMPALQGPARGSAPPGAAAASCPAAASAQTLRSWRRPPPSGPRLFQWPGRRSPGPAAPAEQATERSGAGRSGAGEAALPWCPHQRCGASATAQAPCLLTEKLPPPTCAFCSLSAKLPAAMPRARQAPTTRLTTSCKQAARGGRQRHKANVFFNVPWAAAC